MKRFLAFPDCHHPFADKAAYQVALNAILTFQPDVFALLGDFGDLYSVSSHAGRRPDITSLHVEICDICEKLSELDDLLAKVNCKRKVYIMGNHEYRFERYLCDKAPELYETTSLEKLLSLGVRGWETVPYQEGVWLGDLYITHDIGRAGVNAVRQSMQDMGSHGILFGHTHRLNARYERDVTGRMHMGISGGWLGNKNAGPFNYVAAPKKRDWHQGIVAGYLFPNGNYQVWPVPIENGRCVIEGVRVQG